MNKSRIERNEAPNRRFCLENTSQVHPNTAAPIAAMYSLEVLAKLGHPTVPFGQGSVSSLLPIRVSEPRASEGVKK